MFWYKWSNLFIIVLLAAIGCRPEVKDNGKLPFFDLKKYFTGEAARLTKQYPLIKKTVSYNGQQETKTIGIKHWQQEFDLFINSDINKPAWKNSYAITTCDTGITYQTTDSTLHTYWIGVGMKGNKVKSIYIRNCTHNMLYDTWENLAYYPDSAYLILKTQDVALLGRNVYKITGKFK